jgi:hypothetical protein
MWDTSSISDSLATLMFAVYNLVITPMSPEACQKSFGESRVDLLTRDRSTAVQGLVKMSFLVTRNIEVLQALTLFLFSEPESELTCTLVSAAIRPDQMMGLYSRECRLVKSLIMKCASDSGGNCVASTRGVVLSQTPV